MIKQHSPTQHGQNVTLKKWGFIGDRNEAFFQSHSRTLHSLQKTSDTEQVQTTHKPKNVLQLWEEKAKPVKFRLKKHHL